RRRRKRPRRSDLKLRPLTAPVTPARSGGRSLKLQATARPSRSGGRDLAARVYRTQAGNSVLSVVSNSSERIVAALPKPALATGSYLLVVTSFFSLPNGAV